MNNMLRVLKLHSSEIQVDDEQYVKGAETPLICTALPKAVAAYM